jgi:polyhydroxybutyrate depolymerase
MLFLKLVCLLGLAVPAVAAASGVECQIRVGELERKALVFAPATPKSKNTSSPRPLVLCFHGHGGSAASAARSFGMHRAWPEACVVYPQGVPTPGRLTDPEGKQNGWQFEVGSHGDRDLLFFDALLTTCRERYGIDPEQVFVMGHSNGGAFTYLLWSARSEKIKAVAPSAAVGHKLVPTLKPKPCLHVLGTNDKLVRSAWQEWMVAKLRKVNQCQEPSTAWSKQALRFAPLDPGKGSPLIIYRHSQGHRYPPEATQDIAQFFRELSTPQR